MDCFGHSSFMDLDILDMLTWTIPFDSLWKILWNSVLTWLFWTCGGQYNKIWSLMILIEESFMNFHGLGLGLKTENINNNLNYYIITNFFNTCILFIVIHAIIFYCYTYVLYLYTYIYIVLHKFMIICYKLYSY